MIDANQCNHATEQQLQDIYTCKHELEVLVDNIGYPTTNHYGATGDGLVMAYRAGARLIYMDTCFYALERTQEKNLC